MSDALASTTAEEAGLIRCHCLAHGRRKCSDLEEVFPAESAVVTEALKLGFEHAGEAQAEQLSAAARLAYHQTYSAPIMKELKKWLEQQTVERRVEPKSSLGKALAYLLGHGETLTRFLTVPGAPVDNNTAERALKLGMRQRTNSLCYATAHRATIASLLTSVIAPCRQAGGDALEYLVAVQEHRQAVFAHPAAWLPWTYPTALVPPEVTARPSGAIWARSGSPFHSNTVSSRAQRRTLGVVAVGHHWKRPWERRVVQSQNPGPSETRSLRVVPVRLRKR